MYVVLAVCGFVGLLCPAGAFNVVVAAPRMLPVPYVISAIKGRNTGLIVNGVQCHKASSFQRLHFVL